MTTSDLYSVSQKKFTATEDFGIFSQTYEHF